MPALPLEPANDKNNRFDLVSVCPFRVVSRSSNW